MVVAALLYIYLSVSVWVGFSRLRRRPDLIKLSTPLDEDELYKLLICHQPFGSSKLEHSFSVSGELQKMLKLYEINFAFKCQYKQPIS